MRWISSTPISFICSADNGLLERLERKGMTVFGKCTFGAFLKWTSTIRDFGFLFICWCRFFSCVYLFSTSWVPFTCLLQKRRPCLLIKHFLNYYSKLLHCDWANPPLHLDCSWQPYQYQARGIVNILLEVYNKSHFSESPESLSAASLVMPKWFRLTSETTNKVLKMLLWIWVSLI